MKVGKKTFISKTSLGFHKKEKSNEKLESPLMESANIS
jgi:hypothetical protein